jgi:hypothetical protein
MNTNNELAARFGIREESLRRELLAVEAADLARFRRVGRARVISDDQVQVVRGWLERRGLLGRAAK